ncbi:MAG TPA: class I SAM-dependent methyltransferase [Gaiellaceae bacterium]
MDEIARFNLDRWTALRAAGAPFTRPWLDLDTETSRLRLDPDGKLGEIRGRRVLCLASGGGQQAPAFALLGAEVTTLDLSPEQIERDREAATRYGCRIQAQEGDMRDLSRFGAASFDIVWHGYSLGFVPDAGQVFDQVARVLRPGGRYVFMCANPFVLGMGTADWAGDGYVLRQPYLDGAEVAFHDENWVAGSAASVPAPREFRHTLGALVEGLSENGFVLDALEESTHALPEAEPGSWEHFTTFAPPWLRLWCLHRPDVLPGSV